MLIIYMLINAIMELELECDVFDRKVMLIMANNLVHNLLINNRCFR